MEYFWFYWPYFPLPPLWWVIHVIHVNIREKLYISSCSWFIHLLNEWKNNTDMHVQTVSLRKKKKIKHSHQETENSLLIKEIDMTSIIDSQEKLSRISIVHLCGSFLPHIGWIYFCAKIYFCHMVKTLFLFFFFLLAQWGSSEQNRKILSQLLTW